MLKYMNKPSTCLSEKSVFAVRNDWSRAEVRALFEQPFNELLFQAHSTHRAHFDPNAVQVSTLLSIKTGGCPEDCSYCPQSVHHDTGLEAERLMDIEAVVTAARRAKAAGATRFCMGAAWRNPKGRNFERVLEMVERVRAEGLETCATLGMLDGEQAAALKQAGLDYYNHNLDTSPEFYGEIITTRTYDDRLDTLAHVREAGINVCCGGIVGLGEGREDRVSMLCELANLPEHPGSVPINRLVKVEGTPLDEQPGYRAAGIRAYPRGGAHPDAGLLCAAVGGAHGHERRVAGAVFLRRRQLDFLRREAADHRQSGHRPGRRPVRETGSAPGVADWVKISPSIKY